MDELLNSVPCGVLLFNDAGIILTVNQTLATLLKYNPKDLEGKNIDSILSLASRIFYNTHFFPLVKLQSKADEIFLTLVSRDKKDIPVLSNAVRRQIGGQFENVVVFMPVFERKKYEEEMLLARRTAEKAVSENKELEMLTRVLETRTQELERQNRKALAVTQDIMQFSKIVSHDLQEPIRKIRLFSDLLANSESDVFSPRALSAISKIQNSAERLGRLTAGLQHYVSVDTETPCSDVDLHETFLSAVGRVKEVRSFSDFQVVAETLPTIEGYSAQLELLFFHLLDNAVKFRKPDEKLVVRVVNTFLEENFYQSIPDKYKFVEHVRIIVSDNGRGFDNQYSEYVFELIKKVDSETDDLGIGLALIRKIVHNHSGTIEIQSEAGKGTNVILVLPLRLHHEA